MNGCINLPIHMILYYKSLKYIFPEFKMAHCALMSITNVVYFTLNSETFSTPTTDFIGGQSWAPLLVGAPDKCTF